MEFVIYNKSWARHPQTKLNILNFQESKAKIIDFSALSQRMLQNCVYHNADVSGRISQHKFVRQQLITSAEYCGVVSYCLKLWCPKKISIKNQKIQFLKKIHKISNLQ